MKAKKLFGLALSATMLIQAVPEFLKGNTVKAEGIDESDYIVCDHFESGTDGWIAGEMAEGYKKATLTNIPSYTDANGVTADGVMKVVFDGTGNQYSLGQMQTAYKEFDTPYTYKEGTNVIIKTRILQTGEVNGVSDTQPRFAFKHNRPNVANNTYLENAENYYEHYMLFDAEQHGTNGSGIFYPNGVSEDQVSKGEVLRHKDTTSMNNYWMDVEMVIDGLENTMTLTVTKNNESATVNADITQPPKVYKKKYGWDTEKTVFDALESLTIQQRRGTNTVYVDYVEVYEEKIEASMNVKASYESGEAITVTIDTEIPTVSFKDALEIYDASNNKIVTANTIDAENKVVTLVPATALTDGAEYKVKIKDGALGEYRFASKEKTFKVSSNAYIINDSFASGTDGWIAGEMAEGYKKATITNVSSYTDANGVTANGVMKIVFDGTGNQYNLGQMQTAFREFDTPYTYKEGTNVVIKTRILQTGEVNGVSDTQPRFAFKHNRPNTATNTYLENAENYYEHYMLFDAEQHGTNGSGIFYPNGVSGDQVNKGEVLRHKDTTSMNNYWMDVEMVIDGLENTMTLTVTKNGESATVNADITQPPKVYKKKYGWDTEKTVFDALESLTIQQRRGTNTVYVDFVEVYEEKIEASLNVELSYEKGQPITVTIDTEVPTENFKDALELYDASNNKIATTNTIDDTNKVVTMTPATALTDGAEYKVKVKDGALGDYKFASKEKTFKVSSNSYIINDSFASGTDGWVAGEMAEGYKKATITNVSSYTDANGVTANGVMKLVFDGTGNQYNLGQMQTAFREFETPYTYKEGTNVVIKTRILQTGEVDGVESTEPRFSFRHNRPNVANNTYLENAENYWEHYMLFDAEQHGTNGSGVFYPNGVSGDQVSKGEVLRHKDTTSMNNYWMDVEMVIDGSENTMTLTVIKNGESATVNADITQPPKVYKKKYGWDTEKTAFDALESLTIQQRRGTNTVYVDYVEVYELDTYTKLTDSEGKNVIYLEAGKTVYPEFTVKSKDGESKSYYMISAMYVGGRLEESHIEKITTAGRTYVETDGYKLGDDVSNVTIKTFIWDADTQKPVCDANVYEDDSKKVYVATRENGGSDVTGNGTIEAPYESISKAIAMTNDVNSEIIVDEGNYYIDKTINVNSSKKKADKIC